MDIHPERHKSWIWGDSDKDTKMVLCLTCGHITVYDPQIHLNVEDAEMSAQIMTNPVNSGDPWS